MVELKDLGFTAPGAPPNIEKVKDSWMKMYALLMLIQTRDPAKKEKFDELRNLLAEANENIMELFT